MKLTLNKTVPPAELEAYAADLRWQKEVSGVIVAGSPIATDRASQAMINGAVAYLQNASAGATVQFKTNAGFVDLDYQTMLLIAMSVGNHVQACFALERQALLNIHASPPTISTRKQLEDFFAV